MFVKLRKLTFRDKYLVVVVEEGHFILFVQVVQILRQISYSQFVPPFAVRMFLFIFFLNLAITNIFSILLFAIIIKYSFKGDRCRNDVPDTWLCLDVANNFPPIQGDAVSWRTGFYNAWSRLLVD